MIARPLIWTRDYDIAKKLIEAIKTQDLLTWTPGRWNDWLKRVQRLPVRCRQWIWRKAGENLPNEVIRYLQSWRG